MLRSSPTNPTFHSLPTRVSIPTGITMPFNKSTSCPRTLVLIFLAAAVQISLNPVVAQQTKEKPITSRIVEGENGELFVVQEVLINAPLEKVWDAYTTSEGWKAWIAPVADVDLKMGGTIKTNYRPDGKITDEDANTLHIINYCPNSMITLQAEVSKNWPEILKEQEKQLFNVITFENIGDGKTKIISYGTGYKDTPEFRKLMEFFIPANESTFEKLIAFLEKGTKAFGDN